MVFTLAAAGVLGLVIGSFLNAALYRMHARKSIVRGRSHCPHCNHTLLWHELIPLVSFALQRGRCRACAGRISWQYPAIETITALLFAGATFAYPSAEFFPLLYAWILSAALLFIFVYDMRHTIIPDSALAIIIIATLVFRWEGSGERVLAGVLLALPFLAIVLWSKGRWMGMGDVKLFFVMGLVLSLAGGFVALFLASVLGAIIGVGLVMTGRKTMKSAIPFGPFLVSATIVSFFFGNAIIVWYENIFF